MSKFTTKHYAFLAEDICHFVNADIQYLEEEMNGLEAMGAYVGGLCGQLKQDNPNFNVDKFLDALGEDFAKVTKKYL